MIGIFLVVFMLVVAVFLSGDADLPLLLLPYKPVGAFHNKVVWITGASSGIGAQLAVDMVAAGATVVISARRIDKLEAVAEQCAKVGNRPAVLPIDVTDHASQADAAASVLETYGKVDVLVLNAGLSQRSLAAETPLEVTRQLMELNFMSSVALSNEVLPSMMKRKSGQIVVVSSLSGIFGTPVASSYSATKFALHGYFNALRSEVQKLNNVYVSIVCPGPVESEIGGKSIRVGSTTKTDEKEVKKMPTERCTFLMMKGIYHRLPEMWISDQPYLLVTYIGQYFPWISRAMFTNLMGPARVAAMIDGGNLFDVKKLIVDSLKGIVGTK